MLNVTETQAPQLGIHFVCVTKRTVWLSKDGIRMGGGYGPALIATTTPAPTDGPYKFSPGATITTERYCTKDQLLALQNDIKGKPDKVELLTAVQDGLAAFAALRL